jgi:hypothetical protein
VGVSALEDPITHRKQQGDEVLLFFLQAGIALFHQPVHAAKEVRAPFFRVGLRGLGSEAADTPLVPIPTSQVNDSRPKPRCIARCLTHRLFPALHTAELKFSTARKRLGNGSGRLLVEMIAVRAEGLRFPVADISALVLQDE